MGNPRTGRRPDPAALPSGPPLVAYSRAAVRAAEPGGVVKILLNHSPEEFPEDSLTIRQILDRKGWTFPLIIARVDGALVERRDWETAAVRDGAEVDLHHLVSGG